MSNVILKHISHSYDRTRVLENVDLTIDEGEFYTLLGPSGCGKTTLLRILAGFITPSEGEVWIGDQNITDHGPEKRNMGIVFQNYALFPNMTVRENISYGLRVRRLPKNVQRDRCDYYMELAGMKEYADRRIQDLSGGYYIIPIAYTIAALPMLLTSNEVAIRGLHPSLEEASHSLGADMLRTFSHVILPNIAPGIMAGGILILIRMVGEYTMSALLYGVHNRPISISIITNMQEYNVGISLAYGVLVIAICYASLALIFKLDDRRFM